MITIVLILAFLLAAPAVAQTYSVHSGSYLGFVSLGLEKEIWRGESAAFALDARGGYVPAAIGGRDLFSLSSRARFTLSGLPPLAEHYTLRPYASAGLIYAVDNATFVVLPKQYPRRYYPPTGLYASPALGIGLKRGRHEIFFEVASLDKYIEYRSRNTRHLGYRDIVTWGFGYRRHTEPKEVVSAHGGR